jgi:hypothetical protein
MDRWTPVALALSALLVLGCGRPVLMTAPLRASERPGPMIDFEPEGEVPSFEHLHERVFEPHWL